MQNRTILEDAISESMVREFEAIQIERGFGLTPVFVQYWDLIKRIFIRVSNYYKNGNMGLYALFYAGFMYGVRAERKRRREGKKAYTKIAETDISMFTTYQGVPNNE